MNTPQQIRGQLERAYARVRPQLLAGRIDVFQLSAEACAGLWLHTFGDGSRALAVFESQPHTRRAYDKRFPTLRELLAGTLE